MQKRIYKFDNLKFLLIFLVVLGHFIDFYTGNSNVLKMIFIYNSEFIENSSQITVQSLILVIIGAINWGSIGFLGYDIVGALFGGQGSLLARIIFAIVGIAGLWAIGILFKDKVSVNDGPV